jgi:hypothetical protein
LLQTSAGSNRTSKIMRWPWLHETHSSLTCRRTWRMTGEECKTGLVGRMTGRFSSQPWRRSAATSPECGQYPCFGPHSLTSENARLTSACTHTLATMATTSSCSTATETPNKRSLRERNSLLTCSQPPFHTGASIKAQLQGNRRNHELISSQNGQSDLARTPRTVLQINAGNLFRAAERSWRPCAVGDASTHLPGSD